MIWTCINDQLSNTTKKQVYRENIPQQPATFKLHDVSMGHSLISVFVKFVGLNT